MKATPNDEAELAAAAAVLERKKKDLIEYRNIIDSNPPVLGPDFQNNLASTTHTAYPRKSPQNCHMRSQCAVDRPVKDKPSTAVLRGSVPTRGSSLNTAAPPTTTGDSRGGSKPAATPQPLQVRNRITKKRTTKNNTSGTVSARLQQLEACNQQLEARNQQLEARMQQLERTIATGCSSKNEPSVQNKEAGLCSKIEGLYDMVAIITNQQQQMKYDEFWRHEENMQQFRQVRWELNSITKPAVVFQTGQPVNPAAQTGQSVISPDVNLPVSASPTVELPSPVENTTAVAAVITKRSEISPMRVMKSTVTQEENTVGQMESEQGSVSTEQITTLSTMIKERDELRANVEREDKTIQGCESTVGCMTSEMKQLYIEHVKHIEPQKLRLASLTKQISIQSISNNRIAVAKQDNIIDPPMETLYVKMPVMLITDSFITIPRGTSLMTLLIPYPEETGELLTGGCGPDEQLMYMTVHSLLSLVMITPGTLRHGVSGSYCLEVHNPTDKEFEIPYRTPIGMVTPNPHIFHHPHLHRDFLPYSMKSLNPDDDGELDILAPVPPKLLKNFKDFESDESFIIDNSCDIWQLLCKLHDMRTGALKTDYLIQDAFSPRTELPGPIGPATRYSQFIDTVSAALNAGHTVFHLLKGEDAPIYHNSWPAESDDTNSLLLALEELVQSVDTGPVTLTARATAALRMRRSSRVQSSAVNITDWLTRTPLLKEFKHFTKYPNHMIDKTCDIWVILKSLYNLRMDKRSGNRGILILDKFTPSTPSIRSNNSYLEFLEDIEDAIANGGMKFKIGMSNDAPLFVLELQL